MPRYRYRGTFRSFRAQVNFFRERFGGAVTLVRVGRYYELFDAEARMAAAELGLKLKERARGMSCAAGFPARFLQGYVNRFLAFGCDLAMVEEAPMRGEFVKERYVKEIYRIKRGE